MDPIKFVIPNELYTIIMNYTAERARYGSNPEVMGAHYYRLQDIIIDFMPVTTKEFTTFMKDATIVKNLEEIGKLREIKNLEDRIRDCEKGIVSYKQKLEVLKGEQGRTE